MPMPGPRRNVVATEGLIADYNTGSRARWLHLELDEPDPEELPDELLSPEPEVLPDDAEAAGFAMSPGSLCCRKLAAPYNRGSHQGSDGALDCERWLTRGGGDETGRGEGRGKVVIDKHSWCRLPPDLRQVLSREAAQRAAAPAGDKCIAADIDVFGEGLKH